MNAPLRTFLAWVQRNAVRLAIACGPLILVGVPLLQGKALVWGTPSMQFIPWWVEICRQVGQGQLPLWNSLNGLGAPLIANYQSAFFYPPNWALLPFGLLAGAPGVAWGFTCLAMLHLVWGGWGLAAALRSFGASRLAQTVGGMVFALGGYLVARLEFLSIVWTAAWLPWILLEASSLAAPAANHNPVRAFRVPLKLALAIAMMLLAGHAQLSWYALLFTGAWVLAGSLRGGLRGAVWPVLGLAAAGMVGALLAGIQLAPTAEFLMHSQRSAEYGYAEAMTYSFWPWRFLTMLAPDFFGNPGLGDYWGYASYWEDAMYIGVLPLLLALSTVAGLFKRSSAEGWGDRFFKRFLWAVIATGFVFALGKNTPVFPFLYRYIPTFDMFQAPARYLIWALLGLSILAAAGAERWDCPKGRGLYWLRLGTAGAFAVTLGAGLAWLNLRAVEVTFIRATALAGLWALGAGGLTLLKPYFVRRNRLWLWGALAVAWVAVDLLASGWWLNPMADASFYGASEPRVAQLRTDLAGAKVYMPERVEFLLKFRRFFRASDYRPAGGWLDLRGVLLPNLNLIDNVAMLNNFDPILPGNYANWVSALEEQDAAEQRKWLERVGVGAVVRIDVSQPGGVRFERLTPVKRLSVHPCVEWVGSQAEALEEFSGLAQDLARLILAGGGEQVECEAEIAAWGRVMEARPGDIEIAVTTPKRGYLLVDESGYPGWQARVDGIKAEILPANYLFMAVYIPEGEHEILLQYRPVSFTIGAILSILGLVAITILSLRRKSPLLPG